MYVSLIFILVLVVGVVWAVYRVKNYIRTERQREQDLGVLFSDDQFKAYLEVLKKRNAGKWSTDTGPKTDQASDES